MPAGDREPDIVLPMPQPHRVGDFLVRATLGGGLGTGAVAAGGGDGERPEPFGVAAALVIAAGWRWARRWHPALYARWRRQCSPAELWARAEVRASSAVTHAALWHARWCLPGWGTHLPAREDSPREAHARTLYHVADRLQDRAERLWQSPQVAVAVDWVGLALILAVWHEREERFAAYVM